MMLQKNESFATCNMLNQLLIRLVGRDSEDKFCLQAVADPEFTLT